MRTVCYALAVLLLASCKDAYVLDIPAFHVKQTNMVAIGAKGDVIVNGLPDTAFIIKVNEDNTLSWQMTKPLYARIDDNTLNFIKLSEVKEVKVQGLSLSKAQIKKATANFTEKDDNVAYVSLKDIFKFQYPELSVPDLKSIYACNYDKEAIVLLDTNVTIVSANGKTIQWQSSGPIKTNPFNLNFFRVRRGELAGIDGVNNFFAIKDTAFIARVKPLFTSFGAADIRINWLPKAAKGQSYGWRIDFDKPFRTVIPKKMIEQRFDTLHPYVYLNQQQEGFLPSPRLYTEDFSHAIAQPVGMIDKTFQFKPNEVDEIKGYRFFGISSWKFWTKAYAPLLIAFILGFCIICHYFKMGKRTGLDDYFYENTPAYYEFSNWKRYYLIIYSVLAIILAIRIFIGYNLSFSYPYINFAFPTAQTLAPLMLLAVLCSYLFIWNYNIKQKVSIKVRITYISLIVMATLVVLITDGQAWKGAWQAVIQSYTKASSYHVAIVFAQVYIFSALVVIGLARKWISVSFLGILTIGIFSVAFTKENARFLALIPLIVLLLFYFQSILQWARRLCAKKFVTQNRKVTVRVQFGRNLLNLIKIAVMVLLYIVIAWLGDSGVTITILFFLFAYLFVMGFFSTYYKQATAAELRKAVYMRLGVIAVCLVLMAIVFISFTNISSQYKPNGGDRYKSRITAMYQYDKMREFGYKESEEIAQFFAVLGKYSWPASHDPYERIHPGISSFEDPVVKNDLSMPFGFIYSCGRYWWLYLSGYLGILLVLLFVGLKMVAAPVGYPTNGHITYMLTSYGEIRLLAVCVVCGTAFYLLLSYYGVLPFTGRLMYGLGQDSLAEVIETIAWFSLMGLVGPAKNEE